MLVHAPYIVLKYKKEVENIGFPVDLGFCVFRKIRIVKVGTDFAVY